MSRSVARWVLKRRWKVQVKWSKSPPCPSSVPLGGIVQDNLGSGRDYIVEVAVDPVERELSQLCGDSQRHGARKRPTIRVTAHESDRAAVRIRKHAVTA
jgi:hypothetical protein